MVQFFKNLFNKNDEGFNVNPRIHDTVVVYRNQQYRTYIIDKRARKVLA